MLGNNITQRIESYISYKKIIKRKVETVINKNHITRYLTIIPDSIKVITDSAYWNRIRSQNKYSYIIQDKDSVRSVGIAIIPEKIKEEFKKRIFGIPQDPWLAAEMEHGEYQFSLFRTYNTFLVQLFGNKRIRLYTEGKHVSYLQE